MGLNHRRHSASLLLNTQDIQYRRSPRFQSRYENTSDYFDKTFVKSKHNEISKAEIELNKAKIPKVYSKKRKPKSIKSLKLKETPVTLDEIKTIIQEKEAKTQDQNEIWTLSDEARETVPNSILRIAKNLQAKLNPGFQFADICTEYETPASPRSLCETPTTQTPDIDARDEVAMSYDTPFKDTASQTLPFVTTSISKSSYFTRSRANSLEDNPFTTTPSISPPASSTSSGSRHSLQSAPSRRRHSSVQLAKLSSSASSHSNCSMNQSGDYVLRSRTPIATTPGHHRNRTMANRQEPTYNLRSGLSNHSLRIASSTDCHSNYSQSLRNSPSVSDYSFRRTSSLSRHSNHSLRKKTSFTRRPSNSSLGSASNSRRYSYYALRSNTPSSTRRHGNNTFRKSSTPSVDRYRNKVTSAPQVNDDSCDSDASTSSSNHYGNYSLRSGNRHDNATSAPWNLRSKSSGSPKKHSLFCKQCLWLLCFVCLFVIATS